MKYICMNWIEGDDTLNEAARFALRRAQREFLDASSDPYMAVPVHGMSLWGFTAGVQSSLNQYIVVNNRKFIEFIEREHKRFWPLEVTESSHVVLLQPTWLKTLTTKGATLVA